MSKKLELLVMVVALLEGAIAGVRRPATSPEEDVAIAAFIVPKDQMIRWGRYGRRAAVVGLALLAVSNISLWLNGASPLGLLASCFGFVVVGGSIVSLLIVIHFPPLSNLRRVPDSSPDK